MDQKISAYVINLRSKKWWWPLFRFVVDLSVNKAFQLYRMIETQPEERKLAALGFRRAIVNAYYISPFFETFFHGSRRLHNPAEDLRYDGPNN